MPNNVDNNILSKFEEEILKLKLNSGEYKYKGKVMESIRKMKSLSLSTLLSRLIGTVQYNNIQGDFQGFFYADRHDFGCNTYNEKRPDASNALLNAINIDDQKHSITFLDYNNFEYNNDRQQFQYKNLITHNGINKDVRVEENISSIFTKNINSDFNFNFTVCNDRRFELFIPPCVFTEKHNKFESILKEIDDNSFSKDGNTMKNIYINGVQYKKMFFLVLKIFPHIAWAKEKHTPLNKPRPIKDEEHKLRSLLLFDYLVIAPIQDKSEYYIYPVLTLGEDISVADDRVTKDWSKLDNNNNLRLRHGNEVSFIIAEEELFIKNHKQPLANITTSYDNVKLNPIFHIFVFNNL